MLLLVLWLLVVIIFALLAFTNSLSRAQSMVYSVVAIFIGLFLAYPKIIARVFESVTLLFK